jgi:hypothetical protein
MNSKAIDLLRDSMHKLDTINNDLYTGLNGAVDNAVIEHIKNSITLAAVTVHTAYTNQVEARRDAVELLVSNIKRGKEHILKATECLEGAVNESDMRELGRIELEVTGFMKSLIEEYGLEGKNEQA